jgi:hypothetical protein
MWACGIDGCGHTSDSIEAVVVHQTNEHERHECQVCGTVVPDGYLAIRHAFSEHTRAEYVRAYGASAEEVRKREQVKQKVDQAVDLESVAEQLNGATL